MAYQYILDQITMGTIISFRYKDTSKKFQVTWHSTGQALGGIRAGFRTRTVLVLTTNYMGHLHGLQVEGLTPTEQQYIQSIFHSLYMHKEDFYEPLIAQVEKRKRELEVLNKQRAYLLTQQQKVVVTPQNQDQSMGMVQKGWKMLGSVIGYVKTFGQTPKNQVPMSQDPFVQQEIRQNDLATKMSQQQLDQWIQYLENEKTKFAQIGKIPRDPYRMYHQVIKPMIGRERMPNMYRKFNVNHITTPRVLSSPGIVYG